MLHIFNSKDAKQTARSLERFMARLGFNLKHGQALDALGVMAGFENWAGLDGSMSEKSLNARLIPAALRHIRENEDNDYGREYAVVAHTGFELRYDVEGEVTYLRVCDPLGREIAYWVSDEWAESPEEVIGAILGALVQGAPVETGTRKRVSLSASPAGKGVAPKAAAFVPRVVDVPFEKVASVEINGAWYAVTYVEDQVLGQLHSPAGDLDEESDAFHVAVRLGEDTEGLTLSDLRGLKWNAAKRCFVNRNGMTYQFNLAQTFADFIDAPQPPVSEAQLTVIEEAKRLKTYAVEIRPTLDFRAAAESPERAAAILRERGTEMLPEPLVLRILNDEEIGPFRVEVDGGEYDRVPSLNHAVSIADFLVPMAEHFAEVYDDGGNLLWSRPGTASD